MAFDGHQNTLASAVFEAYQRQEEDTSSHIPWVHATSDNPNEYVGFAQNSFKNRKPIDSTDYEAEADLQGLVSNILDEENSNDQVYSESLSASNSIWSPKTLREELLQCFHSDKSLPNAASFPPNQIYKNINKAPQALAKLSQQQRDESNNQQYHLNLHNGDSYGFRPKKLPPGLSVPGAMNADLPQEQLNKYACLPLSNEKEVSQPTNSFPELSHIFTPQNKANGSPFDSFYEDCFTKPHVNPGHNEQYVQEDMNQLVRSFQSLIGCERDCVSPGDFPNVHKQAVGMQKEDIKTDQYRISSQPVPTQIAPVMQIPKQLLDDLGSVQHGRIGDMRKQTFNRNGFQHLSDFNPNHTEYFQQTKELPATFDLTNQLQERMAMNRESAHLNISQYFNHHIPQSQMHKIKQQMQKEKKRTHGFHGEDFSERQQINAQIAQGKKTPFSQNLYYQGGLQPQRAEGENNVVNAENVQRFVPFIHSVKDLRRHPSSAVKSNYRSQTPSPHGRVPANDMGVLMSGSEASGYNSPVSDMRGCRGQIPFHGTPSGISPLLLMNQEPVIQLYMYLDECDKEWRWLEKERKKTESVLRKAFPGKRIPAVTNLNLPRTPPSPTKLDHIVVNQMREQVKVASLLERMECLCGITLHNNIHTALKRHHMAICITQARCKEDARNIAKHQPQQIQFMENRDTLLMVMALKDLADTTRRLRSALWCGLQMTLPNPVRTQEYHDYEEVTCTEKCSVPFQALRCYLQSSGCCRE